MSYSPAYEQYIQFRDQLARTGETTMPTHFPSPEPTRALWCKFGDHPFSEDEPGWRVITMSAANDININIALTACSKHIPGMPQAITQGEME